MYLRYLAAALLALGCIQPVVAESTNDDIEQLRRELSALKNQYESHVQTLEARLAELEQAPPPVAASASPTAAASAATAARAFNPALSVILNGRYGAYSRDPDDRELAGFQAGLRKAYNQWAHVLELLAPLRAGLNRLIHRQIQGLRVVAGGVGGAAADEEGARVGAARAAQARLERVARAARGAGG